MSTRPDSPDIYEIRLMGHLVDERWASRFEGMTITLTEDGDTLLTGPVIDQAALYGLVKKARDSGLLLRSLRCLPSDRTDC